MDPIPEHVPDEAELVTAAELLARGKTYRADTKKTEALVAEFVDKVTAKARDRREAYRFFAHAFAMVKGHRDRIAGDCRIERAELMGRARVEAEEAKAKKKTGAEG